MVNAFTSARANHAKMVRRRDIEVSSLSGRRRDSE
jgi:hypothetical protein